MQWHDERAKFRYVPNGRLGGKSVQFICPQCAGNVVGAHHTRMGRFKRTRHPLGVPSLPTSDLQQWCCKGSISISIEGLGLVGASLVGHHRTQGCLRMGSQPHRELQQHPPRQRRN